MSKKQLKKICRSCNGIPSRVIKNAKGEVVKQLYNVFNVI